MRDDGQKWRAIVGSDMRRNQGIDVVKVRESVEKFEGRKEGGKTRG